MSAPRYVSTRGHSPAVSFREALLQGLAPDGGLYVPERVPRLVTREWQGAGSLADLGALMLPRWIGPELPRSDTEAVARDAFSFEVPLVRLEGDEWDGVQVLELFHGPTLSFKDFGARTMARLMSRFLAGRNERMTILVATSGDTGSAVADGFAGLPNLRVVLLYPKGQVSAVQEQQLVARRPGVTTLAVKGTFDDCQRMVKAAFQQHSGSKGRLSSANSINIGRLVPQSLYYVWAYRQSGNADMVFSVPSGNLGNLTGGVLAALGGLPVRRFIAAHNANDFLPRVLRGEEEQERPSVRTLSNAMDVGNPSNYERLKALLPAGAIRQRVEGTVVTDAETLESMRRVYEATGYVADPHTAVALEGARRYRMVRREPVVVLSTAHPAKFPGIVREALGFEPTCPARLAAFRRMEGAAVDVEPSLDVLPALLSAGD